MTSTAPTSEQDLMVIKRQLLQLQELHLAGALSNDAFEEGRVKLERRILDCVMSAPAVGVVPPENSVSHASKESPTTRLSTGLLAGVVAVVVAVAAVGYGVFGASAPGSSEMTVSGNEASGAAPSGASTAAPHATNFDQIAAMTDKLAMRLKDKPDDFEGWAMLARSYSVLGRNPDALNAYEKAFALRATDAMLLADFADALAIKNNRSLVGEPMKLVNAALKLDPRNLKALSLAGTNAFEKKDYAAAVKFWEQVVQIGPATNNLVEQVQPSLAEARSLAGLPTAARIEAAASPVAQAALKSVSGTVSLVPALSSQANPDDTVFVFARATGGSRMPVAILKKQVKDLPLQFTLDDSMSMSPNERLSLAGKVTVGARISKSGNAQPQKGDIAGESLSVAVGAKGLSVEINEVIKQ